MSLWVQFNYRRVAQSDLPPYWFPLGPNPPAPESRARASTALVSRFTSTRKTGAVKGVRKINKNRQIACFFQAFRQQSAGDKFTNKKMRGDNLTRSPLTAALYYLNAWMEQAMQVSHNRGARPYVNQISSPVIRNKASRSPTSQLKQRVLNFSNNILTGQTSLSGLQMLPVTFIF